MLNYNTFNQAIYTTKRSIFNFASKLGNGMQKPNLKVSHITVEIPSLKGKKLTMVVVYGYGKEPMVLLTNKQVKKKAEVLSILKAYIIRWRIEEMFRVQKLEFQLEDIRLRSLTSLKRMFLLLSIMITFMTLNVEKKMDFSMPLLSGKRALKQKIRSKCICIVFQLE